LERRPQETIPRIQQILAKPNPAYASANADLCLWLGWVQEVAGDSAGAHQSFLRAQRELEKLLPEQSSNYGLLDDLALVYMELGDKSKALAFAERAMAANPIEKDAVRGPLPVEILARVCARFGETERALNSLEKIMALPYDGAM